MGWLFMRDMGGYVTPRSYLDNQFTYAHADHRLTVLASSMVGSTYYAAMRTDRGIRRSGRLRYRVPHQTKHRRARRLHVRLQRQCAVVALKGVSVMMR
jgi:hypothetical protein